MTILVDECRWPWRGRLWCHMVSDESYDELHRMAARLGFPGQAFQGDHYDLHEDLRSLAIALGAVSVPSRELVVRLRAAGLRARRAASTVSSPGFPLRPPVPADDMPLMLARMHGSMEVGDELPEWAHAPDDVLVGAGFARGDSQRGSARPRPRAHQRRRWHRARTLPDMVGPDMKLLVCGLNPSVVAADAGYGFAGATNRFWKAAVAAELTDRAGDPLRALILHGVGMTDLVKRATPRSAEVAVAEYVDGAARVERLIAWLTPEAVCFVGLEGWRAAVDRRAQAGWQPMPFGGRPAYVMPSTSGLNARVRLDELVGHLKAASEGP